jgi:hypothetical protein
LICGRSAALIQEQQRLNEAIAAEEEALLSAASCGTAVADKHPSLQQQTEHQTEQQQQQEQGLDGGECENMDTLDAFMSDVAQKFEQDKV